MYLGKSGLYDPTPKTTIVQGLSRNHRMLNELKGDKGARLALHPFDTLHRPVHLKGLFDHFVGDLFVNVTDPYECVCSVCVCVIWVISMYV